MGISMECPEGQGFLLIEEEGKIDWMSRADMGCKGPEGQTGGSDSVQSYCAFVFSR